MPSVAQVPGAGISTTTVHIGTANPPTTEVSCQVTILEGNPNPQYLAVPPTACVAGRQVFTGTQRSIRLQWLQDWGETDSLSEFLDDHEGENVFLQFVLDGTAPKWVYEVQAVPGMEGGTMGAPALAETTLPVISRTPTMPV